MIINNLRRHNNGISWIFCTFSRMFCFDSLFTFHMCGMRAPFVTLPKFNYRQLTNILLARNFAFSHQPHTQVSAMLLLDTVDDQLLLSFKNYAANFSFSCRPALNTFVQRNSWPHNCVLLHGTFEHNERSIQFEHNLLLGKTIQLISVVECSNGK